MTFVVWFSLSGWRRKTPASIEDQVVKQLLAVLLTFSAFSRAVCVCVSENVWQKAYDQGFLLKKKKKKNTVQSVFLQSRLSVCLL